MTNTQSSENQKSRLIDYFRILTWPIIVLIIIIMFGSPLRSILNVIPSVLENTESIDIGNVSFKVKKVIANKASTEVRNVLKQLSNDDIEKIIAIGKITDKTTSTYSKDDNTDANLNREIYWAKIGLA